MRAALQQVSARGTFSTDRIEIVLGARELATLLGVDGLRTATDQLIELQLETKLKRQGRELRLVYATRDANPPMLDDRLIRLIASGMRPMTTCSAVRASPARPSAAI